MPTATGQPAGHPMFLHQRAWTTSQLLWRLAMAAIFTPPMLLAYIVGGMGLPLLLLAGLLLALLVFGRCCTWGVTGGWRIVVTPDEVTWETPRNLHGSRSFSVRPSDIQTLASESQGAVEAGRHSARQHDLVMVSGDQYRLHGDLSGIDLEGFCRTLQQLGVRHRQHP